jgi:homoserine kinase
VSTDAPDGGLTVRVPASSANLGAGFDVFGMALDLYADLGLGTAPAGAHQLDEHHPATIALHTAGGDGPCWMRTSIPSGRGLGYSGAARLGGAALGVLAGVADPATVLAERTDEVVDIAAGLEGHGDNVAASLAGGVIAWIGGAPVPLRLGPHLRDARVIVWIPAASTSTDKSRAALAPTVDRADAVHNLAAVVQFTLAIERDEPELLAGATDDRLHQSIRLAAIDGGAAALSAGVGAGAWCGWLSGSGPSLAFLADAGRADDVAAALAGTGRVRTLAIAPRGLHVVTG